MRVRSTVATVLFSALAATLVGSAAFSAALEDTRFVPQLELTDLQPRKVAFAPDDGTLLMVVNGHGRIDLFNISNPDRPAKITEIAAAATDAAFTRKGTSHDKIRIVSGSTDGTIRLWALDGKPTVCVTAAARPPIPYCWMAVPTCGTNPSTGSMT